MGARAPVKKAAKRAVKKAVKKPLKGGRAVAAKSAGGFSLFGKKAEVEKRGLGGEISFLGNFAGDAVKGYGGGNGEALFSLPVVAGAGLWILVLLRFVLFYGFFGDS